MLDRAHLLTPDDVASYLSVPVSWVREHSSGRRLPRLPSFKVGKYWRYRQDEIDRSRIGFDYTLRPILLILRQCCLSVWRGVEHCPAPDGGQMADGFLGYACA
jgi:hypothetical protein